MTGTHVRHVGMLADRACLMPLGNWRLLGSLASAHDGVQVYAAQGIQDAQDQPHRPEIR